MRHVAAYISDVDEETWPLPPEYVYLIDFTIPPVPTDTPLPTDNPLPTEIPRPEEPISIELAESRKLWYGEYGLVATPEYVEIVQDISLACVNNSNTECDAELREKWGINALQGSYVADNCKLLGRRGGGGGFRGAQAPARMRQHFTYCARPVAGLSVGLSSGGCDAHAGACCFTLRASRR